MNVIKEITIGSLYTDFKMPSGKQA